MNNGKLKIELISPISLIVCFAFCIRLTIGLLFTPPLLQDETDYFAIAHSLTQSNIFGLEGVPTAHRAPGYPYILSLIFTIFGESISAVRVIQAIADTITCLLIFIICKRFSLYNTAVIASACYAVFPGNAFYISLVLTETLFTVLLLFTLFLITKREIISSNVGKIIIGVLLGVLTLIRQNASILVGVIIVWELLCSRSIPLTLRRYALVLFSFLVVLTPWLVRNKIQFDRYSLASNGGVNFWIGHNKDATGSFRFHKEQNPLENITGEFERSDIGFREGLNFLIHNPLTEVKLLALKLVRLFEPDFSLMQSLQFKPEWRTYTRAVFMYREFSPAWMFSLHILTMIIMLMGTWSMVFSNSARFDDIALIRLIILGWILGHMVFFSVARFRLPIMPLMIIMASYSIEVWRSKLYTITPFRKYIFALIVVLLVGSWIGIFGMIYFVK